MASTNLPPFKYKDETLAAIGRQIGNLLGWMEQGDVMEKELEPVSQDGVDVIVSVDLSRMREDYFDDPELFDLSVYRTGMWWMCENGIPQNSINGVVSKEALSEEDAAHLIETNLLIKSETGFSLNFPHFTAEQFEKFVSLFDMNDDKLNDLLAELILSVRKNFEKIVPKHLHDQINQWVSGYLHQIIGYVTDELIRRGILRKPDGEKPLTNGVFCVEGKYINL